MAESFGEKRDQHPAGLRCRVFSIFLSSIVAICSALLNCFKDFGVQKVSVGYRMESVAKNGTIELREIRECDGI